MAFDVDEVEAMLLGAAKARSPLTYSEALAALGHRFTRPLMRQLCVALTEVDARARGASRPELAVLVVRQSDRLPGQGWWMTERGYSGEWKGPEARDYVHVLQAKTFSYCSQKNNDE